MTTDKRKALGRGLSALIPGAGTTPSALKRDLFEAAIEDVHASPLNPRQVFDADLLRELAASIKHQGIVQPLVVRARAADRGGGYELIAGERRFRAAQLAGLHRVPVVIKDVSNEVAFELMLVENLQRADLNPVEEAEAYRRLVEDYHHTQEAVAERVGKDRTTVANALRLLKLPLKVREHIASGALAMGHARALLGLESAALIERTALDVIRRQLSVRQTEALVRRERNGQKRVIDSAQPQQRSAGVRDLEQRLERALGTKVRVEQKPGGAGQLHIDYHSLDGLDALLERLLGSHAG